MITQISLKAHRALEKSHEEQLLNYLKSAGIEVGQLLNFGSSVQRQRKIFTLAK